MIPMMLVPTFRASVVFSGWGGGVIQAIHDSIIDEE
jgi:hypothetical protein